LAPLQRRIAALLPRVELTDLVLEIAGWTGFAQAFTHLSEGRARVPDLTLSLCAVLVAEACNVGLEPLMRPDVPALERDRLSWVQQNYLRAETIAAANARLVEAQTRLPLAQLLGGGEVASADGLRFVVPVRTLNAGPNRKYFGAQRGVTYYNFASDQFTGLHGIVIPGTTHEAPYLLESLLEQRTLLEPQEVITDTAGYSDVIFGLFWLLGYQFSPRLADAGEARLWRLDPAADHGPLNGLARHHIQAHRIVSNRDDLLARGGIAEAGDGASRR
jgi:TnpA family transposase